MNTDKAIAMGLHGRYTQRSSVTQAVEVVLRGVSPGRASHWQSSLRLIDQTRGDDVRRCTYNGHFVNGKSALFGSFSFVLSLVTNVSVTQWSAMEASNVILQKDIETRLVQLNCFDGNFEF